MPGADGAGPVALKWLGFLAVLASASMAGFVVGGSYRARAAQLAQLRTLLNLLETEVAYAASALPGALERVASALDGPVARLPLEVAARLRSGEGLTPGDAWRQAAGLIYPRTALVRADLDIVLALAPHLGLTDREDQRRHLRLAAERLRVREEAAQDEQRTSERMWRYLGVLGGLALGLALL